MRTYFARELPLHGTRLTIFSCRYCPSHSGSAQCTYGTRGRCRTPCPRFWRPLPARPSLRLLSHIVEVFRVSAHSHALSLPTLLLSYRATTSKHLCSRSCLPNGCSDLLTSWGLYFASLLQASRALRPMTGPSGACWWSRTTTLRFFRPVLRTASKLSKHMVRNKGLGP